MKEKPIEKKLLQCIDVDDVPFLDEILHGSPRYYGDSDSPESKDLAPPPAYRTGIGSLENLGVGPERITLFGGIPKIGKTTLVNQMVLDALRNNPDLVALVSSAETGPQQITKRLLARLSGVPIQIIERKDIDGEAADRLKEAQKLLYDVAYDVQEKTCGWGSRLMFGRPPFNLLNVVCQLSINLKMAERQPSQAIVVIDFIQCFKTLDRSELTKWKKAWEKSNDPLIPPMTNDLGQIMDDLRALARIGLAVIVVSRLNRQGYDDAALGGFHGSGELEYQCDNAFILTRDAERPGVVVLRHVASRDSEPRDRFLRFDGRIHRFTPLDEGEGRE